MSLRVLMTADAVGGVWTYALELAGALDRLGVETCLVVLGAEPDPSQRREAQRIGSLDLRVGAYRLEWTADPWADVDASGDWLLRLEDEVRPDIVHLNGYAHGALPFRAPKAVVAHSCVTSWWRSVERTEAPASHDEYRRRVRAGIAAADALVAPTRAFLDEVIALHGTPRRAHAIPNGLSWTPSADPVPKEDVILAAGRLWDRAKGLDALDAITDALPFPVWIAGDAQGPDVAANGPRHAIGLGRLTRESLRERMQRAAIFCHPARYEPFGLAPLEAAISGCALVLSDLPTLREVWGDAATWVPRDDAEALRATLTRLAEDPHERARLASVAGARAATFGTHAQGRAYLDLYQDLCAARASASPELVESSP